jgi:hypothetical protein
MSAFEWLAAMIFRDSHPVRQHLSWQAIHFFEFPESVVATRAHEESWEYSRKIIPPENSKLKNSGIPFVFMILFSCFSRMDCPLYSDLPGTPEYLVLFRATCTYYFGRLSFVCFHVATSGATSSVDALCDFCIGGTSRGGALR